ncbi:MAG: hypothetical protein KBT02_12100 [Treponema sp.]|nr:hypothetical protein [Candidatus Treponema caballi]
MNERFQPIKDVIFTLKSIPVKMEDAMANAPAVMMIAGSITTLEKFIAEEETKTEDKG